MGYRSFLLVGLVAGLAISLPACRSRRMVPAKTIAPPSVPVPSPVAQNPSPMAEEAPAPLSNDQIVEQGVMAAVPPPSWANLPPPKVRPVPQKSAREFVVPEPWREIAKGYCCGPGAVRASYLRALRHADGQLAGVALFESGDHRSPFKEVPMSPMLGALVALIGDAGSASVVYDVAGRPEKFILHE